MIFLIKKCGLSAKSYCTILTVATIVSFPLMALWEINIFSLDFFMTSMVHILGVSIAHGPGANTLVKNETIIPISGFLSIAVILSLAITLLLWKRIGNFAIILYATIITLDCIFLMCRIVMHISGATSCFYIIGSFSWKVYGIACLLTSLQKS